MKERKKITRHLQTVLFVYCAGDEHFWHGTWVRFVLVTNASMLEINVLKTYVRSIFSHTHTASYQRRLVSQDDCYSQILTSENGR